MMPRLTYENSTYQNKMPKFLKQGDIINKIISGVIPIVLWCLYAASMQTETIFKNPLLGTLFVLMPIVPAGCQYFIIKNADSISDWVGPFVMAILTFLGTEVVAGNIGTTMHSLFPFFYGEPVVITQLWCILCEILIIYSVYKIISFILPARTVMAFLTTFFFILISMLQNLYTTNLGTTFKFSDLFNVKQFIATLKILVTSSDSAFTVLLQGFAFIIGITIIVAIINKWSTIYDFKERAKGLVVGLLTFAICVGGIYFATYYADENNMSIYKGQASVLISEIGKTNEYTKEFQEQLDAEINNLDLKEKQEQSNINGGISYDDWTVENAQKEAEATTPTPTETSTAP